jgi:hypothetical protein
MTMLMMVREERFGVIVFEGRGINQYLLCAFFNHVHYQLA